MSDDPVYITFSRRLSPGQAETRERLLDAARQQILAEGHAELSMSKVAEQARSSRATLYRLFTSRDHLLAEVTLVWGSAFLKELEEDFPRRGGRAHRVKKVFDRVLAEGAGHRPLLAAALASLTSRDPSSRQVFDRAARLLSALLADRGGEPMVGDMEALILGRFLFAELSLLCAERISEEEARRELHRAIEWTLR